MFKHTLLNFVIKKIDQMANAVNIINLQKCFFDFPN